MSATAPVSESPAAVLERAIAFLRAEVAPNAAALEASPDVLAAMMARAGRARLLALRRPAAFGGPELPAAAYAIFQEEAARASGAFAFLQTQHQSAVSLIARHAAPEFAARVLAGTDDASNLIGLGFSQLRRRGAPSVTAEPEGDGYRVRGKVPWVTGFGVFPRFLLGASLPGGEAVFVLAPLEEGPRVGVEGPMRLVAMESANTVALDLDGLLVRAEDVAFIVPADWIAQQDEINIALQSHFAFGLTRGALDVIRGEAAKPGKEALADAADRLGAELDRLRAETAADGRNAPEERRLALRARAVELMGRCAHAAVAASAGAANAVGHPAGRLWREALVYTVSAQTTAIMTATVARLTRSATDAGP